MYYVYIKEKDSWSKDLIGEFKDYDTAYEKVESELAKNKDIKYVIEQTTGSIDSYGDLIATLVEEN